MKFKIVITFLLVLSSFLGFSQHTSLLFTNPTGVHGGLAGNSGYHRVGSNAGTNVYKRNILPQRKAFTFYNSINYDFLAKKIKGGIGISVSSYLSNSSNTYRATKTERWDLDNG